MRFRQEADNCALTTERVRSSLCRLLAHLAEKFTTGWSGCGLGIDSQGNVWVLPAPAGNFSVWIRAYWPDMAILDGTWKPPVIAVVK